MQILGPNQLVFADGSTQKDLALTTSGATGSVGFTVTQIPAQVASVRKTAASAPLAIGATLTSAEAANLVVTRPGGAGSYGPTISASSVVGVRTRVFASGTTAPAFTVGDATFVQAIKDGNMWFPNFPSGGTGTLTVDMLFDVGTAMTLGKVVDWVMSLNYGGQTTDQWTGIPAVALASTDGVTIASLDALTITSDPADQFGQKKLNGTVNGAASGRWVGIRLLNVPIKYPFIVKALGVQAQTGSGSIPLLANPVYFGVHAVESSGSGASISASSVVGVKTRVFQPGGSTPALSDGGSVGVQAVKDNNYWIPNYPGSATGPVTVDMIMDVGSAVTLGQIGDFLMSVGYGGETSDRWTGITAKALISTDGVTVTTLNALTIADGATEPFSNKKISGTVTGASPARWLGIRLENVATSLYPLILEGFGAQSGGAGAGATADYIVAIGDSSTDFGTTQPPTGSITVYGDPGTRFPLDIYLPSPAASYTLTVPAGLSLVERTSTTVTTTTGSAYPLGNATGPFSPTQTGGGATSAQIAIIGSGKSFDGTFLNLAAGTYLASPALGLNVPTSPDASKTQAPMGMTLKFVGIIPASSYVVASVYSYGEGGMTLFGNSTVGTVVIRIERDGTIQEFTSSAAFSNTQSEDVSVRYTDNASGAGGTIVFLRAGVQVGPAQTTTIKPRLTASAAMESNALTGNTAGGTALKIKNLGFTLDVLTPSYSYVPVGSGAASATRMQNLYVDATGVSTPQAAKTVTYQASGGTAQGVNVVVGPLVVAAGSAYRAVLEDWSTGAAVSHANILVMTRPARQNCRFEDAQLYNLQAPWTECLPQGPVPVINNIAYYCEAVRVGSYVQFQFGYDWTPATMPSNPFGDPTGKESYMVPHKWRIEDSAGNLIARVQRPDGGALNGTDIPRIFAGSYDGNGAAITNATNKWYPHGTVRSGVIWRSGTPTAYTQAVITAQLPRYDLTVPYAMHTGYSNNGGDLRILGNDQLNGFGNTRVMSYEPSNYATLTPQVNVTQDPYRASLYSGNSLAAVASTWLRYTPFNQMGRSPITGPGGVRDDRAAIAEPVAQYMYDITASRPHDAKPYGAIALDFVTGYVSDPYHCFEAGRCVPLFKGANATRVITLRNHYYGPGEASTPADRAYYIQGGPTYTLVASQNPFRTYVPSKGSAADKPYFGTNEIDAAHAHQFPHWGSMLWQSPEFAFLGHKMWDQDRLYWNIIIAEPSATRWAERDGAWQFLHAALAWKTASSNSDRLYSRAEVIAFVRQDFEWFSDNHKTSTPGFDNPPANVYTGGQTDTAKVAYAGASRFGVMFPVGPGFGQHDFFAGYWLTALSIGEKLGFNAAVRAASTKAGAVLDFLIARHRQRIVGRINQAPRANPGGGADYEFVIWTQAAIAAAGGTVASLPQNYAAVATQNGNGPTWDKIIVSGSTIDRDGQGLDQLIAGPSQLKYQLGLSGSDLDTAQSTVTGWRNQKKSEQAALGVNAGSSWFKYLNAINNPAIS